MTDLANEAHLSLSQLVRVLVEAYGKSRIAYLTMPRAERMGSSEHYGSSDCGDRL